MLALHTVARRGAILDLTWGRTDLDRRLIDFGQGRGLKRRTVVPINDALLPVIQAAYQIRTCEFVVEWRSKQVADVKTTFRKAAIRAELPWLHPHLLRHSAATWMALAGVPLREIARFLGDREDVVERRYAKFHPDYLRSAARALE